jgi:pSer/pThr/pTyr-binding forkhead associated (FHA) protein
VFEEPKEKRVQSKERLKLIFEDMPIKLESDDIVGREAKGDKLLALMTTVSRQHAKFLFEDKKWFVEDLNSANGTYLESVDNRISEKTEIRDGDKLFISRSVEIIVKI